MKVWPKNDEMRKILTHPSDRVPFREEGPGEWPDDPFTHRRMADGDVFDYDPNPSAVEASAVEAKVMKPPAATKK